MELANTGLGRYVINAEFSNAILPSPPGNVEEENQIAGLADPGQLMEQRQRDERLVQACLPDRARNPHLSLA